MTESGILKQRRRTGGRAVKAMDSLSIVLCTCGLESRLRRLKALVHVQKAQRISKSTTRIWHNLF